MDARPAAARSPEALPTTPTRWRDLDAGMGMLPRRRVEPVAVPDDAPAVPPPPETPAPLSELRPESSRGRVLVAVAVMVHGLARQSVDLSDLVVRAWELAPDLFGLRGHADKHPDAARVMGRLSGDLGPVALGYVRALGEGRYEFTTKGARWWASVGGPWFFAQGDAR